jgi:hypothetical protein
MYEHYPDVDLFEKEHLQIYWVKKGKIFEIKQNDYDGEEMIVCFDEKQWITA